MGENEGIYLSDEITIDGNGMGSSTPEVPRHRRHRVVRFPRYIWPVIAAIAFAMVYLMLSMSLQPLVPTLGQEPAPIWVVEGEDTTLTELANDLSAPVDHIGSSGSVFRLTGHLVIEPTGRLAIDSEALFIGEEFSNERLRIDVNGTLIIRDSVLLPTDPENDTFAGITVHPRGQLIVERSLIREGDPTIRIMDPTSDLANRILIQDSQIDADGTGIRIDDVQDGAWLSHSHNVSFALTDDLIVNATGHGVSNLSNKTVIWKLAAVNLTTSGGLDLNTTFPTGTEPGLHVLYSIMHEPANSSDILATGASLLLVDDPEGDGNLTSVRNTTTQRWEWGGDGLAEYDALTWLRRSNVASSDTWNVTTTARSGVAGVVRAHQTSARHVVTAAWDPVDVDGFGPQALVAGGGEDLWVGLWAHDAMVVQPAGSPDWTPRVLQGDPYSAGDDDRLWFLDWSGTDRIRSAWADDGTHAASSGLPIGTQSGLAVCQLSAIESVLLRWSDNGSHDARRWNASAWAWEENSTTLNLSHASWFDTSAAITCMDEDGDDRADHILQLDRSQSMLYVAELGWNATSETFDVTAHTNHTWNDTGSASGLAARVNGGSLEVARVPLGLSVADRTSWQVIPGSGDLSNVSTPSLAYTGSGLARAGGPIGVAAGNTSANRSAYLQLDPADASGDWVLSDPASGEAADDLTPATMHREDLVLAVCDLDDDGERELLEFRPDGHWSRWARTSSASSIASVPSTGDWTQEATGALTLPERIDAVVSAACLDADAEAPRRLVIVDGDGDTLVLIAPMASLAAGESDSTDLLDPANWHELPATTLDAPAGMPRTGWMGTRLTFDGGPVVDVPAIGHLAARLSVPRWRPDVGPFQVDVRIEGPAMAAASVEIETENGSGNSTTVWLNGSGAWDGTLSTVDLSEGRHAISLTPPELPLGATLAPATARVITLKAWTVIAANASLSNVAMNVSSGPALHIDGVAVVASGLRLEGNASSPAAAIRIQANAEVGLSQVSIAHHSHHALHVTDSNLSLDGYRASAIEGRLLLAADSHVRGSSWELLAQAPADAPGLAHTGGSLHVDLVSVDGVDRLLDLDDVNAVLSNLTISNNDRLGVIDGGTPTVEVRIENLSLAGDHAVNGTSLGAGSGVNVTIAHWNVSVTNGTYDLLQFLEGDHRIENSSLVAAGTVLHTEDDTTVDVRESGLSSNGSISVIDGHDTSNVSLLGVVLTGGDPQVRDTARIAARVRPTFIPWHADLPGATMNITVHHHTRGTAVSAEFPVVSDPGSETEPPEFAGIHPIEWDQPGLLIDLWQLDGDGTSTPRTGLINRTPMARVEWSYTIGGGGFNVPLLSARRIPIQLTEDIDHDGIADYDEEQDGAKGLHAATWPMIHDVLALDGESIRALGVGDLTIAPSTWTGTHRLWMRWFSDIGACAGVQIEQLGVGAWNNSTACAPVPSTPSWIPLWTTDLDTDAAAVKVDIDTNGSVIIVDEAWLIPDGQTPRAAWHPDVDRDGIADGLEEHQPGGWMPVHPGATGWGPVTGVSLSMWDPHGWKAVFTGSNATFQMPASPHGEAAEVWLHGTDPADQFNVSIDNGSWTAVGFAPDSSQSMELAPLRWTNGTIVTIRFGEDLRLRSGGSASISALWYRLPWVHSYSSTAANGTVQHMGVDIERASPDARLSVNASAILQLRDAEPADSVVAVDPLTGWTVTVDRNCTISTYEGREDTALWTRPGDCSAGAPVAADAEDGYVAWLAQDGPDTPLLVRIEPVHPNATHRQGTVSLVNGPTMPSLDLWVQWANGRLLARNQEMWYHLEWNGTAWTSYLLGASPGSDPMARALRDHGHASPAAGMVEACVVNDHIFFLVGDNLTPDPTDPEDPEDPEDPTDPEDPQNDPWSTFNWTLYSGMISTAEVESPVAATSRMRGQWALDPVRHGMIRQWKGGYVDPQLTCLYAEVVVAFENENLTDEYGPDRMSWPFTHHSELFALDTRTGAWDDLTISNDTARRYGEAMGTTLVIADPQSAQLRELRDEQGEIDLGRSRTVFNAGNGTLWGVPRISPWNMMVPTGHTGTIQMAIPYEGRYDLWYSEVAIKQPVVDGKMALRGAYIDHEIRLSGLASHRLDDRFTYLVEVDASLSSTATVILVEGRQASAAGATDTDNDGLADGDEIGHQALSEYGQFVDATTHLGCMDSQQGPGSSERWADYNAKGYLKVNEACRVQDGAILQWRPQEGPGAALTWPLEVETAGLHRLTLHSSSIVETSANVVLPFGESVIGQPITTGTQLSGSAAAAPQWNDEAAVSWLSDLLEVHVVDNLGRSAEVMADRTWVEEARLEAMPDGRWVLRVRLDGWIDVHVEQPGAHDVRIGWQPDGWHADAFDPLDVDDGPTDIDDFELIAAAPILAFGWGPLGSSVISTDSDGDGLFDGIDAAIEESDADEDGLTDGQEAEFGTSSVARDTDADGVLDGIEVGLSGLTSSNCTNNATSWRSNTSNRGHGLAACSGVQLEGAVSWLHRRLAGTSLTFAPVSYLDANDSSWTEPLDLDTDEDGLPDGWIDGWMYVGDTADGDIARVDPAAGVASVLELASIGAYDETRWRLGPDRDGLIGIMEGEDLNVDGAAGSQRTSVWMTALDHFALNSSGELDPTDGDSDADTIPDGWELLTHAWFLDHTNQQSLQDALTADASNDNDLAAGMHLALPENHETRLQRLALQGKQVAVALPFTIPDLANHTATAGSGNWTIESIQFHGDGLPDRADIAIVHQDVFNASAYQDGLWWCLDPELTSAPQAGSLEFERAYRNDLGQYEVRFSRPVSVADLSDHSLMLRLPHRGGRNYSTASIDLMVSDGHSATGYSTRSLVDPEDANWSTTNVTWRVALSATLSGAIVGDHLNASLEYLLGTLPTRADSDSAFVVGHRDLLNDSAEVAPSWQASGASDRLDPDEVEVRWVTTVPKGRLGWRWMTAGASGQSIAVSNVSAPSQHWWFDFSTNGHVLDGLSATPCGDPAALTRFARLDDGGWLGTDAPLDGRDGTPQWLCVMHPAAHWEDPGTWNHRKAQGLAFTLGSGTSPENGWNWTVGEWPRHQVGFGGAPFQRDADGDGLVDGLESDGGWNTSGGGSPLTAWRTEITGRSSSYLTPAGFLDDTDGDGIVDAWDMDADGDLAIDGLEVGWLVDLDGDGLPGAIDSDSDGDGVPDGSEYLPETDSDEDGFELLVELPGEVTRTVHIGANALDVDSDDDGLLDGWVDGLRWDVFTTSTTNASGSSWIDEAGPDNVTSLGLDNTSLAKWFPNRTALDDSGTESRRLAGGAIFGTEDVDGAPLQLKGAWSFEPTFWSSSSPVRHPWEGEDHDLVAGFNVSAGDTDPSRQDTDGDGLLDGTAMFTGWDRDASEDWSQIDTDWTWSGSRRAANSGGGGWDRGALLTPDGAPLGWRGDRGGWEAAWRGAWARAGEIVGPYSHRGWVPLTPWVVEWQPNVETQLACSSSAVRHAGQSQSDNLTRAGWLDNVLFDGTNTTIWTACWDVELNITAGNGSEHEWQWLGWSDGTDRDTDSDGLDDNHEREGRRMQPQVPLWQEWRGDLSDDTHIVRAWYLSAGDPRDDDTDDDSRSDGLEWSAWTALDDVDTDHDGLTDDLEDTDADGERDANETDPNRLDTDNDGLPDAGRTRWDAVKIAWNETNRHLAQGAASWTSTWMGELDHTGAINLSDPLDRDSDDDGAIDGDEYIVCRQYCADPTDHSQIHDMLNSVDGDSDGLWDSGEVRDLVRPAFHKDTVAAQLTGVANDWIEHSSDPTDGDTDDDGLSDGWEPFPFTDTEGDGTINVRDEQSVDVSNKLDAELAFLLGTNATNGTWELLQLARNTTRDRLEFPNPVTVGSTRDFAAPTIVSAAELPREMEPVHEPVFTFDAVEVGGTEILVNQHDASLDTILANVTGGGDVWALWVPLGPAWLRLRIVSSGPKAELDAQEHPTANDTRISALISTVHVINTDLDFDGAENTVENLYGTSTLDRDTDNDGVPDGMDIALCEFSLTRPHSSLLTLKNGSIDLCVDVDGDGLASYNDPDSDGDGLRDGIELGRSAPLADIHDLLDDPNPIPGTDTTATVNGGSALNWSAPDADLGSRTDPLLVDTDGDGLPDGWLDLDHDLDWSNDPGELDPHQALTTPTSNGDGTHTLWSSTVNWDDVASTATLQQTLRGGEDWDGDGATTGVEPDPQDADSDDDGLPDGPMTSFRQALWDHWSDAASADSPLHTLLNEQEGGEYVYRELLLTTCAGESWTGRSTLHAANRIGLGTPLHRVDWDNDSLVNLRDGDSDGDGLSDGWECGVSLGVLNEAGLTESLDQGDGTVVVRGTDTSHRNWAAAPEDGELFTSPWDADSDDDGLSDREEDRAVDGAIGEKESHPLLYDTDADGIMDGTEMGRTSSSLTGQLSWATDTTHHTPIWSAMPDWTTTSTAIYTFVPDADTWNNSKPYSDDSDGDGLLDGHEDVNRNGRWDDVDINNVNATSGGHGWLGSSATNTVIGGVWSCQPGTLERESAALWTDGVGNPPEHWHYVPACELSATSPDSDGDQALDGDEITGWEVITYTERMDPGTDVNNAQLHGVHSVLHEDSSPWDNDTDDDGALDGVERNWASNPRHNDTDGDTFADNDEISVGDSPVVKESTPPAVESNKDALTFSMAVRYDDGAFHLVRRFGVEMRFSDAAGIQYARVWLAPAGAGRQAAGTAPQSAIDIIALAQRTSDGSAITDLATASAVNNGLVNEWDSSLTMERGLRTNVTWNGTISSRVEISKSTIIELVLTSVSGLGAFFSGFSVTDHLDELGSTQLGEQFGGWNLFIEASDTNGNTGVGEVEFNDLLKETDAAVWQQLLDWGDALKSWSEQALTFARDWVLQKIRDSLLPAIENLYNQFISGAIDLYPYAEYFVVMLESVASLEFSDWLDHRFTQQVLGYAINLIQHWNHRTNTLDLVATLADKVKESLNELAERLQEVVPRSPEDIAEILGSMLEAVKSAFVSFHQSILSLLDSLEVPGSLVIAQYGSLLIRAGFSVVKLTPAGFVDTIISKIIEGLFDAVKKYLIEDIADELENLIPGVDVSTALSGRAEGRGIIDEIVPSFSKVALSASALLAVLVTIGMVLGALLGIGVGNSKLLHPIFAQAASAGRQVLSFLTAAMREVANAGRLVATAAAVGLTPVLGLAAFALGSFVWWAFDKLFIEPIRNPTIISNYDAHLHDTLFKVDKSGRGTSLLIGIPFYALVLDAFAIGATIAIVTKVPGVAFTGFGVTMLVVTTALVGVEIFYSGNDIVGLLAGFGLVIAASANLAYLLSSGIGLKGWPGWISTGLAVLEFIAAILFLANDVVDLLTRGPTDQEVEDCLAQYSVSDPDRYARCWLDG